jgi:hypothetical protein
MATRRRVCSSREKPRSGPRKAKGGSDTSIFELKQSGNAWAESILAPFVDNDGGYPGWGLLAPASGNLYNTTSSASTCNGGTLFELMPSGKRRNVHTLWSFGNTVEHDGDDPEGGLLMDSAGVVYETTEQGGTDDWDSCIRSFCPEVFSPVSDQGFARRIHLRRAINAQIASSAPNGHAPCRNP